MNHIISKGEKWEGNARIRMIEINVMSIIRILRRYHCL